MASGQATGGLLALDPGRDDAVGRLRAFVIKEAAGCRKRFAERHQQPMQFEDLRIKHGLEEGARDLRQLRLDASLGIDLKGEGDVGTGLPDDSFESSFLSAEARIERGLRTADQIDDLVDGDVGVALADEQRRRLAHDFLTARLGQASTAARTWRAGNSWLASTDLRARWNVSSIGHVE